MLFSNVVLGSYFSALIMMFILIWSKRSSKDARVLGIQFSCTMNFDKILSNVSFSASNYSDRQSFSDLIRTILLPILFDSWCCLTLNSINYSCCCLKLWPNLANLSWSFVSKWYIEYGVSEVRVTTSCQMIFD